ncbi:putative CCR4-NOT transcription complex subunit 8 [Blattamonas nauphoetae]|uniref:poly(A)-specific ribonuclease n=1 Tax=Blattamonas nauphoetae TaxID=2049346 RepID=A0ABQ9YM11_9EUKA|nr:putative CCR4-NOT transcription complex subunit 8 [Blattamonas nauphoetae]
MHMERALTAAHELIQRQEARLFVLQTEHIQLTQALEQAKSTIQQTTEQLQKNEERWKTEEADLLAQLAATKESHNSLMEQQEGKWVVFHPVNKSSYSVMVSTGDFESPNPGSSPGRSNFSFFDPLFMLLMVFYFVFEQMEAFGCDLKEKKAKISDRALSTDTDHINFYKQHYTKNTISLWIATAFLLSERPYNPNPTHPLSTPPPLTNCSVTTTLSIQGNEFPVWSNREKEKERMEEQRKKREEENRRKQIPVQQVIRTEEKETEKACNNLIQATRLSEATATTIRTANSVNPDSASNMEGQEKSEILDVWAHNFEDQLSKITELIEDYPYVGLDTEFPGVIFRPVNVTGNISYDRVKKNVDELTLIQIGISLSNQKGDRPSGISTWQFNFKFDSTKYERSFHSLQLLQSAGMDFKRFNEEGIDPFAFAEALTASNIVMNPELTWVTFSANFDFAYMIKLLTNRPLPTKEHHFHTLLHCFFPVLYDLKIVTQTKRGLKSLANETDVARHGSEHQAGSDSLLTLMIYLKYINDHFNGHIDKEKYNWMISGMGMDMGDTADPAADYANSTTYVDPSEIGADAPYVTGTTTPMPIDPEFNNYMPTSFEDFSFGVSGLLSGPSQMVPSPSPTESPLGIRFQQPLPEHPLGPQPFTNFYPPNFEQNLTFAPRNGNSVFIQGYPKHSIPSFQPAQLRSSSPQYLFSANAPPFHPDNQTSPQNNGSDLHIPTLTAQANIQTGQYSPFVPTQQNSKTDSNKERTSL